MELLTFMKLAFVMLGACHPTLRTHQFYAGRCVGEVEEAASPARGCVGEVVEAASPAGACVGEVVEAASPARGCVGEVVEAASPAGACVGEVVEAASPARGCVGKVVEAASPARGCVGEVVEAASPARGCVGEVVEAESPARGCVGEVVEAASPAAGCVGEVLGAVQGSRCSSIIITDGVISPHFVLRVMGMFQMSITVLEVSTACQDADVMLTQLSHLVDKARLVRQVSWCVTVVVVSDDLAFLATFAQWSLKGRLLVWSTRLLVLTRLPLHHLQVLVSSHWTFSMMNTMLMIIEASPSIISMRCSLYVSLPYSQHGSEVVRIASWTMRHGLILHSTLRMFPEKFEKLVTRVHDYLAKILLGFLCTLWLYICCILVVSVRTLWLYSGCILVVSVHALCLYSSCILVVSVHALWLYSSCVLVVSVHAL
ncbi:uncharacterized protein [Procambarus clarkii]|uniref:uncharacterized protein n=1 Tax=Procambarus clarkii TaxID=6728 RepID=UPI0037446CE5